MTPEAVSAAGRPATVGPALPQKYAPRAAWFDRLIPCGPAQIKLNIISVDGSPPTGQAIVKACEVISANGAILSSTPSRDAGFAILHRGQDALWLLLHWWIEGGIATHRLWHAGLDDEPIFESADPILMACVWELGVIDFERRAWLETVMAGQPAEAYLTRTFPRGFV